MASSPQQHWSSHTGFLLASIGAAVGLGNLWKFPYMAGTNGGGAFVLIYLLTIFAIAIPIAAAELTLGRLGRHGPIQGVKELINRYARPPIILFLSSGVGVFASFLLLSFYAVIAGWVIGYIYLTLNGTMSDITVDNSSSIFNAMLANPLELIGYQFAFLAVIGLILIRNAVGGIERANMIMMPLLFFMLLLIALYGIFFGNAQAALAYLFMPDFSQISAETVQRAVGQGFFSVGVGCAMLVTYGTFLNRAVNVGRAAITIGLADTAIALIAGFGIFAIVFALQLDPTEGPGLLFTTLPIAFAQLPLGSVVALIFFVLVFFAALTSGIALVEVVRNAVETSYDITPRRALAITLGASFIAGLATVFSFNIWSEFRLINYGMFSELSLFDLKDYATTTILMPLSGLSVILFTCWAIPVADLRTAFGAWGTLFWVWIWLGRIIVPIGIIWMFIGGF